MNTARVCLFVFCLFLCSSLIASQATSTQLQGFLFDQAPDYMIHKNYPYNYWVYGPSNAKWYDVPYNGSAGNANNTNGWYGTDFELPLFYYGEVETPNANSVLYNGEYGMMGKECNKSNNYQNCGQIGSDRTPVYQYPGTSPFRSINSPASFYNWFHSTQQSYVVPYNITLTPASPGSRVYGYSGSFFPLDGQGWQDWNVDDYGHKHNYNFCFMCNSFFSYQGGEIFQFTGDDDMWVYIDNMLVMDLGGIHTALSKMVSLDDIGLQKQQNYRFDMFYCERHTTASDLALNTTIAISCPQGALDWCNVCGGTGQTCCTAAIINQCAKTANNVCYNYTCAIHGGCANQSIAAQCDLDPKLQCVSGSCDPQLGCVVNHKVCPTADACHINGCSNDTGCYSNAITCPGNKCYLSGCDPTTGCYQTPVNCTDNDPCTQDLCSNSTGCSHPQITCPPRACNTVQCVPGYGCNYTQVKCADGQLCEVSTGACNVACLLTPCNDTDACNPQTCNMVTGKCDSTPKNCTDGSACHIPSCVNGQCQQTEISCASFNTGSPCIPAICDDKLGCTAGTNMCTAPNPCTYAVCNGTLSCDVEINSTACDDHNVCTTDSCDSSQATIQAACVHTNITCTASNACMNVTGCDAVQGCQQGNITCPPVTNKCLVTFCDNSLGCLVQNATCLNQDPDCYYSTCDWDTQQCVTTQRPNWPSQQRSNGVTCYAYYNQAATGGIIAAGIIAAIVIAAVIFAVLAAVGARQAYIYMQMKAGNMGAAQGNPLYTASNQGGISPLYS